MTILRVFLAFLLTAMCFATAAAAEATDTRRLTADERATITYATAKDVLDACRHTGFAKLRETKGEVKIVADGARVKAITPMRFAPTDY